MVGSRGWPGVGGQKDVPREGLLGPVGPEEPGEGRRGCRVSPGGHGLASPGVFACEDRGDPAEGGLEGEGSPKRLVRFPLGICGEVP